MEKRTLIASMVMVGILFAVNIGGLLRYGYRGSDTIIVIAVPVIAAFLLAFYYFKAKHPYFQPIGVKES